MAKIKKLNFQKSMIELNDEFPENEFENKFFSVICYHRPKIIVLKISNNVFNTIMSHCTYPCSCQDNYIKWKITPVYLAPDFETSKGLRIEFKIHSIHYKFLLEIDEVLFLSLLNGFILLTKETNNQTIFDENYICYSIDLPTTVISDRIFKPNLDKLIIPKKQKLQDALTSKK